MASLSQMLMRDAVQGSQPDIIGDVEKGARAGLQLAQVSDQLENQKLQLENNKIKAATGKMAIMSDWTNRILFAHSDTQARKIAQRWQKVAADLRIHVDDGFIDDMISRRGTLKKDINQVMDVLKGMDPQKGLSSGFYEQYFRIFGNPDTVELRKGMEQAMQISMQAESARARVAEAEARTKAAEARAKTEPQKLEATLEELQAKTEKTRAQTEQARAKTEQIKLDNEMKRFKYQIAPQEWALQQQILQGRINDSALKKYEFEYRKQYNQDKLDLERDKFEYDKELKELEIIADSKEQKNKLIESMVKYNEKSNGIPAKLRENTIQLNKTRTAMESIRKAVRLGPQGVQLYRDAIKELISVKEGGKISDKDFSLIASRAGLPGLRDQAEEFIGQISIGRAEGVIEILKQVESNVLKDRITYDNELENQLKLRAKLPGAPENGVEGLRKMIQISPPAKGKSGGTTTSATTEGTFKSPPLPKDERILKRLQEEVRAGRIKNPEQAEKLLRRSLEPNESAIFENMQKEGK